MRPWRIVTVWFWFRARRRKTPVWAWRTVTVRCGVASAAIVVSKKPYAAQESAAIAASYVALVEGQCGSAL